nr:MAG TPA: hypothetical protein [Caudoviricetes sp.]
MDGNSWLSISSNLLINLRCSFLNNNFLFLINLMYSIYYVKSYIISYDCLIYNCLNQFK